MPSLRNVLVKYAEEPQLPDAKLGAGKAGKKPAEAPINTNKLRRDLKAINKGNQRYFFICVAMIVVLFIASIGVILTNLNNPAIIKVVMAAFGISSSGLITMMIKLWREKSNIDLMMMLAINMDAATLKTIVEILAKKLK